MKKLLYAVCVALFARFAAGEVATPVNELDPGGISLALQSKAIVIVAVNWDKKSTCPGYRSVGLTGLGFDRLRTPAPAADAPVDLLLHGSSSLFTDRGFESLAFVVEPGAYALSSYDIKYARSWLISAVASRRRNWLIRDGKAFAGSFEVRAGETIYLGHFSVNCEGEGQVLIPWRTYPVDEAAFMEYLGGLKSAFPALGTSRVQLRLFRTRRYGEDYYTERGRKAEMEGNWTLAETNYERSQEESDRDFVTYPERVGSAYNLGRARGHVCKFDDADKLMADALALSEKLYGNGSPEVAMELIESARMNFDRGEFDKSLPFFERGLRVIENEGITLSDPIALAGLYDDYATALEKTGNNAAAEIAKGAAGDVRTAHAGLSPTFIPVRYRPSCSADASPQQASEATAAELTQAAQAAQAGRLLFHGRIPVYKTEVAYPEKALRAGIEGYVIADAYVSKEGTVTQVKIAAAEPAGWFEEEVMKMLMQWKFSPDRKDYIVRVPVNFQFRD